MSQKRDLILNTIIYAIGNFGTKILSYIMVLVYSYFVRPDDLGYYDLVLTTIGMLEPIILFQINDGVFRYLVSKEEDNNLVISTSFYFVLTNTIVTSIIEIIVCSANNLRYIPWITIYLLSFTLFSYFQDVIRGLGKNKFYAKIGIINSIIMLLIEILGLIVFGLGVEALFISKALSHAICVVIMFIAIKELRHIKLPNFNKEILRKLLRYSAPLVPNTICWWVINSSDRYIILYFLGTDYNGIYSFANKFPTVITTVTSIFYLAWQENAIKSYKNSDRDDYFSDVFEKYYKLLFTLTLAAPFATKLIIQYLAQYDYKSAWEFTGALYIAAVFSALSSFLGLGYQISKETKRSLPSTFASALINIGVNVSLIKTISLHAASISTLVAYYFLFVIRIFHTRRYYKLRVNWFEFYSLLFSCIIAIFATFIIENTAIELILEAITILVFAILNNNILKGIKKIIGARKKHL